MYGCEADMYIFSMWYQEPAWVCDQFEAIVSNNGDWFNVVFGLCLGLLCTICAKNMIKIGARNNVSESWGTKTDLPYGGRIREKDEHTWR